MEWVLLLLAGFLTLTEGQSELMGINSNGSYLSIHMLVTFIRLSFVSSIGAS